MEQSWRIARERCSAKIKDYQFLVKPTIILAIIYLVAISAILRANFYYIDDLGRAKLGYTEWEYYSRYLTVFSAFFLHADTYLTDISPLPQLLAVVFMALASTISIYVITDSKKITVWSIIAAIPMGLSPYFLECLSYKYDSVYIAFSVLISVVPLLEHKGNPRFYIFCSILSSMCMCMTYQASSGVYPMLVVMVCIRRWLEGEKPLEIFKFAIISAISYLVGLTIFKTFIMTEVENYASTSVPPIIQFIPNMIGNYKQFAKNLLSDFKSEWLVLITVLCITFVCSIILTTMQKKIVTAVLAVPALIVLLALSFGVYPFLDNPSYFPRSMYGFGVAIAFIGIFVLSREHKKFFAKVACFLLSWAFFSFAFTYGNALYMQSQYTDYRIMEAVDDIVDSGILTEPGPKSLQITGTIGHAPAIKNMPQDYQILNRLVPVTFQDSSWGWGAFGMLAYYGLNGIEIIQLEDCWDAGLPIIVDNVYHKISSDGQVIWIDLYE